MDNTETTQNTENHHINVFEKNIQALLEVDQATAILLQETTPQGSFETFVGSDPASINFVDKRDFKPLFITDPIKETMKKLQELDDLQLYPHLYFFGLGNGILYKLLLANNESLEHLVIIEPEVEILFNVLNLLDFSQEIRTRRIEFHIAHKVNKIIAEYIFGFTTTTLYSRLYDLRLFNSYYGKYTDEYLRVNKLFTEVIESIVISLGNDSNDSLVGLKQHLLNMPEMLINPSYQHFIKNVGNTNIAIIVSTGPSLNKQLPLLKEIEPYVTIFCIDASFPILTKAGIKPDVVLTLERVKESAKFYTETPLQAQEGVMFAITSIAHQETLKAITKGQKILPMRPFPYTFYFQLDDFGYSGIGMSAANMAYETICHAGFANIIFIGQDLAFGEDGTSHSKGAVYGEREITKNDVNQVIQQESKQPIMVEAYGGERLVESTYVWRLFLKFFEIEIAKTHPNIKVINATEGGVRIRGTQEAPFRDVVEAVDRSKVKTPITLTPPSKKEYEKYLAKGKKKIEQILSKGYKHKAKIEKVFLEICKMTEELERLNKSNQLEKINFKKMNRLVDRINNVKDFFASDKHMRVFDNIIQSYIVHQEMEIAKISTRMIRTEIEEKARQIDWIYAHRYWFFSLAGGIHTVLEVIKQSVEDWMEIPEKYQTKDEEPQSSQKSSIEEGKLKI